MKKINLRELYPDVYTTDFFVDVTEEVMETIRAAERAEAAYERKMYRYKAQYSLDCENGIENAVLLKPQTPEMLLEEKQFQEQVYAAVMKLPEKQAKRIYARYYLGMTVNEIAEVDKDYVLKEFGLKVSNLYISQVKRKCGIEVGENYNLPKSENARVPQCPKEKEDAIKAALKYFAMI